MSCYDPTTNAYYDVEAGTPGYERAGAICPVDPEAVALCELPSVTTGEWTDIQEGTLTVQEAVDGVCYDEPYPSGAPNPYQDQYDGPSISADRRTDAERTADRERERARACQEEALRSRPQCVPGTLGVVCGPQVTYQNCMEGGLPNLPSAARPPSYWNPPSTGLVPSPDAVQTPR